MKKEYVKMVERKIVDVTCDICGEIAKGRQCCICKRDVCDTHAHREYDRYGGDHSEKYCIECWNARKPFENILKELEEKYYSDIEKIEQEWKDSILDKKRKTGEGIELKS